MNKNSTIKKLQWNIENIIMISIEHLEINQILALMTSLVDMLINKPNQTRPVLVYHTSTLHWDLDMKNNTIYGL